jgi:lysophospholipase L1-like esterase
LDPKLKKLLNSDNYLDYSWKLDGHYNAKGYALLGEIIAEELTLNYPEFITQKE